MTRTLTIAAFAALLVIVPMAAQNPTPAPVQQSMAARSTVYAPRGVIATSQPLASAAGLAVLQQGGNAIDAAVTAAAVLAVVEPHMTSMGGDLFAMVWSAKDKNLHGLNASGRSGSLMTRETLASRGRTRVSQGVEAITVPGALSGWAALLERFGTLSLAQALAPAIRIAEEGFPVTPIIADDWAGEVALLRRDPAASATFLIGGTRAPKAGEWFRNPELSKTMKEVADKGAKHLYGGELGQRVAAHVQKQGGFLTPEDFAAHKADWIQPVSVPYQGYRLWELPPNSQGIAALEMLRILETYDLKKMGHNSAAYLHHLIEAKKLAYTDIEYYVGDEAATKQPVDFFLSDEYVRSRRALIDPAKAMPRPEPGREATHSDTIYLAAADAQGNMVSLINSVFDYFGSGVVVPGTGLLLHDRGTAFTMTEGRANTVGPKKRPFHTIIPAFVTKTTKNAGVLRDATGEEPWLAFGVMGGAMQPQGHVQVLLNLVLFGQDLQTAADAARFRHMSGVRVLLEPPIGADVRGGLKALGHDVGTGGKDCRLLLGPLLPQPGLDLGSCGLVFLLTGMGQVLDFGLRSGKHCCRLIPCADKALLKLPFDLHQLGEVGCGRARHSMTCFGVRHMPSASRHVRVVSTLAASSAGDRAGRMGGRRAIWSASEQDLTSGNLKASSLRWWHLLIQD